MVFRTWERIEPISHRGLLRRLLAASALYMDACASGRVCDGCKGDSGEEECVPSYLLAFLEKVVSFARSSRPERDFGLRDASCFFWRLPQLEHCRDWSGKSETQ